MMNLAVLYDEKRRAGLAGLVDAGEERIDRSAERILGCDRARGRR